MQHTVNRYRIFEDALAAGVDGIYTDRIKPYELSWVGLTNSIQTTEQTVTVKGKEAKLTHPRNLRHALCPSAADGTAWQKVFR